MIETAHTAPEAPSEPLKSDLAKIEKDVLHTETKEKLGGLFAGIEKGLLNNDKVKGFDIARAINMKPESRGNKAIMNKEVFIKQFQQLGTIIVDSTTYETKDITDPYFAVKLLLRLLGHTGINNTPLSLNKFTNKNEITEQQNLFMALLKFQNLNYNEKNKTQSSYVGGVADGIIGGITLKGLLQDFKKLQQKGLAKTPTQQEIKEEIKVKETLPTQEVKKETPLTNTTIEQKKDNENELFLKNYFSAEQFKDIEEILQDNDQEVLIFYKKLSTLIKDFESLLPETDEATKKINKETIQYIMIKRIHEIHDMKNLKIDGPNNKKISISYGNPQDIVKSLTKVIQTDINTEFNINTNKQTAKAEETESITIKSYNLVIDGKTINNVFCFDERGVSLAPEQGKKVYHKIIKNIDTTTRDEYKLSLNKKTNTLMVENIEQKKDNNNLEPIVSINY